MDPRLVTAHHRGGRRPGRPDRLHRRSPSRSCGSSRTGGEPRSGRGSGSLPALLFLIVFLVYPTIGTIIHSFQNTAGTKFVGLDNYVYFFTSPTTLVAAQEQRAVGHPADRCSRSASGCSSRSSSTASATSRWPRRVIFLPLAISMVARQRDLAVHVRLQAAGRRRRPGR